MGIYIDYATNLSLTQISVQDIYYYRKLVVFNSSDHNLFSINIKCYVYHKGKVGKRSDEVKYF